jgi:hypothetical protein
MWIWTAPIAAVITLWSGRSHAAQFNYCEPLRAYYPTVIRCPVPWRSVITDQKSNQVYDQGSYKPHERDACKRPEVSARVLSEFNSMVGTPGYQKRQIVSIEGLISPGPIDEGKGNSLICHGSLVLDGGAKESGTVNIFDPGGAAPLSISWESDYDAEKRIASGDWHSFKGDIGTWSGIPPLPASASRVMTKTASSDCSVADAVGHVEHVWLSGKDCEDWINAAKDLAKYGPTPVQVYGYKIDKCRRCQLRSATLVLLYGAAGSVWVQQRSSICRRPAWWRAPSARLPPG